MFFTVTVANLHYLHHLASPPVVLLDQVPHIIHVSILQDAVINFF